MWITILPMINPHLSSPAISFPQAHSWVETRPSFRLIPHWTRLLFLMIAEEEKKIRSNPLAAGSELLKSVFGAI
jgi:hypothetical protein